MLHHLGRAGSLLPLRRFFEAAGPAAASTEARPTHPDTISASAWLARFPRPDPSLVGKEELHQVLLPCLFTALFLIGFMTAGRSWEQMHRARTTAAWPYTRAIILSSEVQPLVSSAGVRWQPVIRYSYQAGKREIVGTRLSREEPVYGYDERQARRYVDRYPQGAAVIAYYNPDHISDSVLEQTAPRSAYLGLYLGVFVATVGLLLLVLPRKSPAKGYLSSRV
jgi:hypothetical protein